MNGEEKKNEEEAKKKKKGFWIQPKSMNCELLCSSATEAFFG
jgi:endonuclease YncB( thermonuclease family)